MVHRYISLDASVRLRRYSTKGRLFCQTQIWVQRRFPDGKRPYAVPHNHFYDRIIFTALCSLPDVIPAKTLELRFPGRKKYNAKKRSATKGGGWARWLMARAIRLKSLDFNGVGGRETRAARKQFRLTCKYRSWQHTAVSSECVR